MADIIGGAPCEQRGWTDDVGRHTLRAALLVARRRSRPKPVNDVRIAAKPADDLLIDGSASLTITQATWNGHGRRKGTAALV
jgi:hypothetical protein